MIKTNIKMRVTPEQSKKVQEICFENGIYWNTSATKKDVLDIRSKFLYIEDTITHDVPCEDDIDDNDIVEMEDFYKNVDLLEINPDFFIRTNGTCIENPDEHLDRLDDIVDEAIKEVSKEDSHNAHYKAQKIDTIARCRANMTLEQQKAICIFNIDRYLHREKGQNLSDIQKIRDYLGWLEEIENKLKDKE